MEDRVSSLERQVATVAAKVDNLINEANQQREDLRRLREKQEADIARLAAKQEADVKELLKQINDTWRHTMIGVGGMIVALGAFLVTVLR